MKNRPIYLDYQSTTPVDPRVCDVIDKVMRENFGNPHSRNHFYGWESEEICEVAREQVAKVIGADAKEIIFTSGATESNNLALQGIANFYGPKNGGVKNHIITVSTEHKCVINTCRFLSEKEGFDVTFLPVEKDGLLDLDLLERSITSKTLCISVMTVHNEIGVIQDIVQIGKIARKHGVFFHTDAAQAFGKIKIDVNEANIDLMSISGHKIYGPKGIGALYVRRKPRVRILPIIQGGGQERGFRSGTLATPIVAGFGCAAELCMIEMEKDFEHAKKLSDMFKKEIFSIPEVYLNGHETKRIPHNINVSFAFIEGESMIMAVKELAISSGSACTSASLEPSYVIRSLGVPDEIAHTSIRIGIGRFSTEDEISFASDLFKQKIDALRNLSPLWEMHQEGIDISKIEWKGH